MRLAILSDIHGNLLGLDAVLEDIRANGPIDQIIVAGDLAWGGPRPAEVIERLREIGARAVMGNMDAYLLGDRSPFPTRESEHSRAHPLVRWTESKVGKEHIEFLQALPFSLRLNVDGPGRLLVVHANPHNLDDPLLLDRPAAEILPLVEGAEADVIAHGHLHINGSCNLEGLQLVNVASAGLPRDGDTRPAWDLFEWNPEARVWTFTPRRVAYDLEEAVADFLASGMPGADHRARILMDASY